jgi:membrane protease YdiL (CAAX protease family)
MKKSYKYIFLSFFISWTIWLLNILLKESISQDIRNVLYLVGALGPFLATLLLSYKDFRKTLHIKFDKKWIFVTFLMLLSLCLISLIPCFILGKCTSFEGIGLTDQIPVKNIVLIWIIWTLTFGLGEEVGLRGYLYPRMEKEIGNKKAILLTGLIWGFWHIPIFIYNETFVPAEPGLFGLIFTLLCGSIILSWITKKSKYSVLPAILLHGTFNFFYFSNYSNGFIPMAISLFVIGIGLVLIRTKWSTEE